MGSAATMKRYYYAGTARLAMRTGEGEPKWLLGDHLGSTSRVVNYDGSVIPADQLYYPWGENRFTNGSLPTQYQFTGQYRQAAIGLDYFNARWYDPALGRFSQPDTIVPESQGVQAYDRFAYANNNALKYTDPSGHKACDSEFGDDCNGGGGGATYGMTWIERIMLRPKDWLVNNSWVARRFQITFSPGWSLEQKWQVYIAVSLVGEALARVTEASDSAWQAFNEVLGPVTFQMGNCSQCPKNGGYAGGFPVIAFDNLMKGYKGIANVIHELGHGFDSRFWSVEDQMTNLPSTFAWEKSNLPQNSSGFALRISEVDSASELFADMFLGWVTNKWGSKARSDWMTTNMNEWVQ